MYVNLPNQKVKKLKSLFSTEQVNQVFTDPALKHNSSQKLSKTRSEYGNKLRESRKLSLFYGNLSKKYLQKVFQRCSSSPSRTTEKIFLSLESRLDVVLYRAGFFESVVAAKQMIRTGGITVNKKKIISPGYIVIPGDIVSVSGKKNKKAALPFSLRNTIACKKESNWRFGADSHLLSLIELKKATLFLKFMNKVLNLKLLYNKSSDIIAKFNKNNKLTAFNYFVQSFTLIPKKDTRAIFQVNAKNDSILISKGIPSNSLLRQERDTSKKGLNGTQSANGLRNNSKSKVSGTEEKSKKRSMITSFFSRKQFKSKQSFACSDNNLKVSNNLVFSNYLLNFKKQLVGLQKKSNCFFRQKNQQFFKDQSFFVSKRAKALHLEVSYRSLTIVFLFPPQRICFPNFINLPVVYR